MEYRSVSIKDVIGRVIRNTRITNTEYIDSMNEWIPEAMGMLKTRVVLSPKHIDLKVNFHKTQIPCGLQSILAVEYKGQRLRYYTGDKTFTSNKGKEAVNVAYVSTPKVVKKMEVGSIYGFTVTDAGTITVDTIWYEGGPSSPVNITLAGPGADLTQLKATLDAIGIGVFTVSWIGNTLSIITDSTEHEIKHLTVTTGSGTVLTPATVSYGDLTGEITHYSTQKVDISSVLSYGYSEATYYTEMGYINTSFCDGTIRLYYLEVPLDDEGFPLIPDNENYKQALYWYVRGMMIGAGYPDPVFKYSDCEQKFELHGARALGEIRYPSTDQTEAVYNNQVRLIFNDNAWANFFENSSETTLY